MASEKRKVDGDLSFNFIRIQLSMAMTLSSQSVNLNSNEKNLPEKSNLEKKFTYAYYLLTWNKAFERLCLLV